MTSSLRVRFGAVSPPGIVDRATRSTGAACGTLAALVGLRAAVYFLLGPGLILDDWTAAGNREFQGVLSIADSGRLMSRPVEWLTYTLIYGVAGSSAKWLLVLTTLLNVAAVCALFVAFRRFYSPRTSVIICAAWILVPNHNSMTAWAANTQSVVAFTLLCLGIYALSRGWATAAACCLAGAVLGYQLTIPPAVLATLFIGTRFVPLAAETPSPTQPLTLFRRAAVMAAILLGVAWTTIEPTYPLRVAGPRPWVYVSAHFGEGLFASSGAVTILALLFVVTAAGGIVTSLYLYWQGGRYRGRGPALAVVRPYHHGVGRPRHGSFRQPSLRDDRPPLCGVVGRGRHGLGGHSTNSVRLTSPYRRLPSCCVVYLLRVWSVCFSDLLEQGRGRCTRTPGIYR